MSLAGCVNRRMFLIQRIIAPAAVMIIGAILWGAGAGIGCTLNCSGYQTCTTSCPGMALTTLGWVLDGVGGLWLAISLIWMFVEGRPNFCAE